MPSNKLAAIRYFYLDQMLSDRHHNYSRTDLCEKCNEKLRRDGYEEVSKRTIELDLNAMADAPFSMEIVDDMIVCGKRIVRYADQTQSIFSKPLSEDEKRLLKEVLNTLGRFSGLDNFAWLQDLKEKLEDKRSFSTLSGLSFGNDIEDRPVISFEDNRYLRNKEYLSKLFTFITNRQTISVIYKRYSDEQANEIVVFPYMLKQYNNRWYLMCTPAGDIESGYDPNRIFNLALDRFEGDVIPKIKPTFKECAVNLEERFEEIIGITFHPENPVEEIIFAAKIDTALPYIETKPLHESQRVCMDEKYHIDGYKTLCIDCRYNLELLSRLSSYGDGIVILSPEHIREKMINRLHDQLLSYEKLNIFNSM